MRWHAAHELSEAFDDHNAFLHVVLGMIALGERFDRLAGVRAREPAGTDADDPALLVLLGVAALRARVGALVDGVPAQSTSPAARGTAAPALRGLLV